MEPDTWPVSLPLDGGAVVDCAAAKRFGVAVAAGTAAAGDVGVAVVGIVTMAMLLQQLSQAEMESSRHQQRLSSPRQVGALSFVLPYCIPCVVSAAAAVDVDGADAAAAPLSPHQQPTVTVAADLMKVQVIDDVTKNVALLPLYRPVLQRPSFGAVATAAGAAVVGTLYYDLFEHKLLAPHNTCTPAVAVSSHD